MARAPRLSGRRLLRDARRLRRRRQRRRRCLTAGIRPVPTRVKSASCWTPHASGTCSMTSCRTRSRHVDSFDQYATAEELLDALNRRGPCRRQGPLLQLPHDAPGRTMPSSRPASSSDSGCARGSMDDRLWLTDVYEDSPAEDGGLSHGASRSRTIDSQAMVSFRSQPSSPRIPNLEEAFGPATEGLGARHAASCCRAAQPTEAVFTKDGWSTITARSPADGGPAVLPLPVESDRPGGVPEPAFVHIDRGRGTPLREAYAAFPRAGHRVLHRRPALQQRRPRAVSRS